MFRPLAGILLPLGLMVGIPLEPFGDGWTRPLGLSLGWTKPLELGLVPVPLRWTLAGLVLALRGSSFTIFKLVACFLKPAPMLLF